MGGRAFGGPGWNRGAMARGGRRSLSGAGADERCGKMDVRVPSTGRVPKGWAASHVRGDGGCRSVVVAGGSGGGMEKDGLQLHEGRRDWSWRRGASCSQEPSDPIPAEGVVQCRLAMLGPPGFFCLWRRRAVSFFFFSLASSGQQQPRPGDQSRPRLTMPLANAKVSTRDVSVLKCPYSRGKQHNTASRRKAELGSL